MSAHTIRLHRVLRATPEKVYRAFLDAEALVKWIPPNGFTGKVHHLEAKVGGTYRMSFITAIGITIALREADEIEESISMEILAKLERFGRYRARIIEDAGRRIRSHRRSETGGEP